MRSTLPLTLALAALLSTAPSLAQSRTAPKAAPAPKAPAPSSGGFSFSFGTSHGRLGANATSMSDELRAYFGAAKGAGILVQKVTPGTPAAAAGLKVGDVITKVAGEAIDSPGDVGRALSDKKKGDTVTLGVVRGHRSYQLKAKLDTDPSDDVDFDLNLDDMSNLFKALVPNGQAKGWVKQWHWSWPPGSGAPSAKSAPSGPDLLHRFEELKKRFREMQSQP
jgi:membrane-associated protease RseP (regulator of RpoE activity)